MEDINQITPINQVTLDEWQQWKEDIRNKLQETAENFVYIGYRLKQIRDSGRLDGAADIFEFAQREYGLGKSSTSRFIAINEKYSEGGNSLELKEEYRRFSSSKLSEMLTLPDAECQLITERTTVKEIRELKNFVKEPIEDENGIVEEQIEYNPLQKCIIDFFKDSSKAAVLDKVMELLGCPIEGNFKEAHELINPSGQCSHKKGIIFLFMYDYSTGVKYKDLTKPEPITMSWREFLEGIYEIYCQYSAAGESIHTSFYGEEIEPEKEPEKVEEKVEETQQNQGVEPSVATSQQDEKIEENSEEEGEENEEINDDSEEVSEESEEREETSADAEEPGRDSGVLGDAEGACRDSEEVQSEDGQDGETGSSRLSDICSDSDSDGAEEEEGCQNDASVNRDRELAKKIQLEVSEKFSMIVTTERHAETAQDWKNIRHRLNSLCCDIETLIMYLEAAEEGESDEEE